MWIIFVQCWPCSLISKRFFTYCKEYFSFKTWGHVYIFQIKFILNHTSMLLLGMTVIDVYTILHKKVIFEHPVYISCYHDGRTTSRPINWHVSLCPTQRKMSDSCWVFFVIREWGTSTKWWPVVLNVLTCVDIIHVTMNDVPIQITRWKWRMGTKYNLLLSNEQ